MADEPINPQYISEVISAFPETMTLAYKQALLYFDDYWVQSRHNLAIGLHITETEAQKLIKQFRREGLIALTYCSAEDDGWLMGSGYIITDFGKAVRNHLFPEGAPE
jgi:hypothetical protein